MSFTSGTATSVPDLIAKLDAFLTLGHSLDPIYTGNADGTIEGLVGTASSVVETITVSFTSSTAFTVSGSVSGSLGSGTVGTPFTSSVCAFTVVAGSAPWASGHTITFVMTPPWTRMRFSTVENDVNSYSCWRAPGNDGISAIYVAMQRIMNATGDYDNLRLNGYIAYDPGLGFHSQPGGMFSGGPLLPLLRVGSMPYWIAANGRRVVIVVKVSTVYIAGYLGLIVPYLNPSAVPYPLLIGGSMAYNSEPVATSTNWRWSVQSNFISTFPKAIGNNTVNPADYPCRFRNTGGAFIPFSGVARVTGNNSGGLITPDTSVGQDLRAGPDGSYPILPMVLSESNPPCVWGEMDGVGWVSGHANTAENTVKQNRIPWLVVQDIFRNAKQHYFALKMA